MAKLDNDKHELFCQEYSKTGMSTESYIKVYNTKKRTTAEVNASRLLSNAKIKERINELSNTVLSDSIATMAEIKEFWTNIIRNTQEASKNRLKASELMAKSYGAFLDKVELSGKVTNVNLNSTELSEEELLKLAKNYGVEIDD